METKHTKGEWIRDGRLVYAIGKKGKYDANLFSCSVSNDNLLLSADEVEANAKLIALSPKMYDYILDKANRGCKEAKELLSTLG